MFFPKSTYKAPARPTGSRVLYTTRMTFNVIALCYLLAFVAAAEAFEGTHSNSRYLDPVTVTASFSETSISRSGLSVSVIGSREISNLGFVKPVEFLRLVPGVAIAQNGSIGGGLSSVFVRGANSGQTLFLLDGIPLYNAASSSRSPRLEMLNMASIARVEILRGGQSSLYGSDALGGVINFISHPRQNRAFAPSFTAEYGSYQSLNLTINLKGSTKAIDYDFAGSWESTAGASKAQEPIGAATPFAANPYTNFTLTKKLVIHPNDEMRLTFFGRYGGAATSIDIGAFADSTNKNLDDSSLVLRGSWEHQVNSVWRYSLTHQFSQDQETNIDTSAFFPYNSWESGVNQSGNFLSHFALGRSEMSAGLDWRVESMTNHSTYGGQPLTNAAILGLFARYGLDLGPVTASVGGRLDNHSTFGLVGTFSAGLSWQHASGLGLSANGGNSFKAPSLYQLFSPIYGRTNLKPENGWSLDAGVHFSKTNLLRVSATYFLQMFTNQINFVSAYTNLSGSRSQGVELDFRLNPDPRYAIGLTYTFLDARNLADNSFLIRRPAHAASLYGDLRLLGRLSLGASLGYTSSRNDAYFDPMTYVQTPVTVPEYWKLDARLSFDLAKQATLFIRGENLLDQKVSTVYGFKNPGILLYGGFKLSF